MVLHQQDITYSLTIPALHSLYLYSRSQVYQKISATLISGLSTVDIASDLVLVSSRTQNFPANAVLCFDYPVRYDLIHEGRKIAGAAQKRNKNGLLHQGSIQLMECNTAIDREAIITSLIYGFKGLLSGNYSEYIPDSNFQIKVNQLSQTKYNQDAWNKKR